jgi:hypothetical protein
MLNCGRKLLAKDFKNIQRQEEDEEKAARLSAGLSSSPRSSAVTARVTDITRQGLISNHRRLHEHEVYGFIIRDLIPHANRSGQTTSPTQVLSTLRPIPAGRPQDSFPFNIPPEPMQQLSDARQPMPPQGSFGPAQHREIGQFIPQSPLQSHFAQPPMMISGTGEPDGSHDQRDWEVERGQWWGQVRQYYYGATDGSQTRGGGGRSGDGGSRN